AVQRPKTGAPALAHYGRHKIPRFLADKSHPNSQPPVSFPMFVLRHAFAALVTLALILPAPVSAVSMMDPFNLPAAMDGGTAKVGDGVAYADGARHKLDVYAPEQRGETAPVVF